jgi:preprotein translocase subunit SecE
MTVMTTTTHEEAGRELTAKTLGLTRWVQMAFVAFWLLLVWLLDKIVTIVWDKFAEPQPLVVTAGSLLVAAAVTYALYRHERVNQVANEVVGELTKVTWPTRKETQVATVVVIVTSLIAAAIIGVFDAAWSWVTDFIYKV